MSGDENVKCSREPYWEEMSDKDKVERMRYVVKTQKSIIERLSGEIEKLREHSHNASGEILIPYSSRRGTSEQERSRSDKYF